MSGALLAYVARLHDSDVGLVELYLVCNFNVHVYEKHVWSWKGMRYVVNIVIAIGFALTDQLLIAFFVSVMSDGNEAHSDA